MAPMPDVPNVAKIDLDYNDGVGSFGSRFFYQWPEGSPTTANCVSFAGSIGSAWNSHISPMVSENITLASVTVEDLTSHISNSGTDTTGWDGSLSGDACPNNVTFDIQFLIPNRYRGGHPMIHMPGPTAAELETTRTWTSEYLANYATAWAAFIASVIGVDIGPFNLGLHCTLHGYRNPPPSGGVDVRFPTGYRMRPTVGTQRRRARPLR